MKEDILKQGVFGWNELMTSDVEAAKKFYAGLFGWKMEDAAMEGAKYTMIKVDGEPVGGIMSVPAERKGVSPSWGVYVTVEDVDATADRVAKLGGKLLHPPTDIPKVGRFCTIQDPQGAVVSAISWANR